jgi:ankyrin repeat protein
MTFVRITAYGLVLAITACAAVGCAKGYNTELMNASRSGNVEQIRTLLKGNSAVNFGDADGDTALHAAAKHGQVDAIRVLVREGHANIDARDEDAQTPLHLACKKGELGAVRALLEAGADVNAKDKDRWTALHFAAREGSAEVITVLLSKGAKVNALAINTEDDDDEDDRHQSLITPYDLAKMNGNGEACAVLDKAGGKMREELNRPAGE